MQVRTWQRIAIAIGMTGLAAGLAWSQAPRDRVSVAQAVSPRQTRVSGQYLVTLAPGADARVIADVYGRFGIKGTEGLGRNVFLVTLTEDPGPAKIEELRANHALINAAQPNFVPQGKRWWSIQ